MTIPNLITIARLLLVPLTVWLMLTGEPVVAFWIFLLAGVSDAIDGFLARQFDMRSKLGGFLDPLADKVLLMSIYVTLAVLREIPLWVTILVVSRDVLIVGGVLLAWMLAHPMAMRPRAVSKANTGAQIILAAIVLGDLAFSIDLAKLRLGMVVLVGVLTIGSALVYVVDWIRHMASAGDAGLGTTSDDGTVR